ncbi:unnamed protein product [Cuscuta epithymum]|uniref:Uncharacterized protein n=1 Tax=Cuscuta epithymum TaxID=186058 RepID=A0AAV0GFB0_9ASTE|nr:unnamed protein product [Cuscuta epithymum]CAH9146076.1 unnamed protein product [Cuscuta epithymum]
MKPNSKALLDLERNASSLESKLVFRNGYENFKSQRAKISPSEKTSPIPPIHQSQFLGKVKDFLGVISEANKKLEVDAKNNPENYDIEALTGEESQFIEMDLMLGVAELQSKEAIAAAESAIAGNQPVMIPHESTSSDDDDDDSSDDDLECESEEHFPDNGRTGKPTEEYSASKPSRNEKHSRKRSKIVELS